MSLSHVCACGMWRFLSDQYFPVFFGSLFFSFCHFIISSIFVFYWFFWMHSPFLSQYLLRFYAISEYRIFLCFKDLDQCFWVTVCLLFHIFHILPYSMYFSIFYRVFITVHFCYAIFVFHRSSSMLLSYSMFIVPATTRLLAGCQQLNIALGYWPPANNQILAGTTNTSTCNVIGVIKRVKRDNMLRLYWV